MSVISVKELAKTFRVGMRAKQVEAVRRLHLDVEANEVFGFVGPNGAGKSTTIHLLLGLIRPTRGGGTVLGYPLGSLASRARVGYLPELPNFHGYLKARELLDMVGRLGGCNSTELARSIPELLQRVGLAEHRESYLRTFSKGMLQRVGLAMALVGDPELVILDEPMSGLDPIGRHIVRSVILELKAAGRTVFFSSHVLPDIESLCDRVALISHGEIVRVATVQELVHGGDIRHEIQVRAPAAPPESFEGVCRVDQVGDSWRIVVEGESAATAVVDWARSSGGTIVAMVPVRESLEEVVVRLVSADRGEVAS